MHVKSWTHSERMFWIVQLLNFCFWSYTDLLSFSDFHGWCSVLDNEKKKLVFELNKGLIYAVPLHPYFATSNFTHVGAQYVVRENSKITPRISDPSNFDSASKRVCIEWRVDNRFNLSNTKPISLSMPFWRTAKMHFFEQSVPEKRECAELLSLWIWFPI